MDKQEINCKLVKALECARNEENAGSEETKKPLVKVGPESRYYRETRKALAKAGFDVEKLTYLQIDIIMEPSEAPENFYHDGEINEKTAISLWKSRLKEVGLSSSEIRLAVKTVLKRR